MPVISIKEYAKNNNISYEAVRQQVVRYADELGDHLIKEGRQQFLDEEAVAFLDARRQKNPVVIYQAAKDERIEELEAENGNLLKQLTLTQGMLIEEQRQLAEIKDKAGNIMRLEAEATSLKEAAKASEERHKQDIESLEGIHQRDLQGIRDLHAEAIRLKDDQISTKDAEIRDAKDKIQQQVEELKIAAARVAEVEQDKQDLRDDLDVAARRLVKIRAKTEELASAKWWQRKRIFRELRDLQGQAERSKKNRHEDD